MIWANTYYSAAFNNDWTQWQDDNKNLKSVCVLLVEDVVKELDVVEEEEHLVLAHLVVDSDHRVGGDVDVDGEGDFALASTTITKMQTTTTTLQVWQCCWPSNNHPQWQQNKTTTTTTTATNWNCCWPSSVDRARLSQSQPGQAAWRGGWQPDNNYHDENCFDKNDKWSNIEARERYRKIRKYLYWYS